MSDALTIAEAEGGILRVVLTGRWTNDRGGDVEARAQTIMQALSGRAAGISLVFDLSGIERLDTLGAWVIGKIRHGAQQAGHAVSFSGVREEHKVLLDEVSYRIFKDTGAVRSSKLVVFLVDVGQTVVGAWRDLLHGTAFLGQIVAALAKLIIQPWRFRMPSLVAHMEQIGYRGLPIIALISFLVGCIVSQQGIFQLRRFGAEAFVVDLIGVLSLRELAVLLTSIMVAGRSGSAFTAEIGSMKMREEIDALRVMGLDPIEVLVVPRILALLIMLPILTFLAGMASILGGALIAWFYGGISFEVFLSRLQATIGMNTFLVGLIKAPFMALVIGLIACVEGLAVQGSAESLGRQVTSSVVKAIFMVIVVDGLFAMFFASIRY
jgi:phospholipid/cholesterol/gamma-HCH transport system permease protein